MERGEEEDGDAACQHHLWKAPGARARPSQKGTEHALPVLLTELRVCRVFAACDLHMRWVEACWPQFPR